MNTIPIPTDTETASQVCAQAHARVRVLEQAL